MNTTTNILYRQTICIVMLLTMMMVGGNMNAWGQEEKVIYSTNFQDWKEAEPTISPTTFEKKTSDGQTLTFSFINSSINPQGTHTKFVSVSVGYLLAEKNDETHHNTAAYFETSALKSVTKVKFVQAATGGKGKRGWNVAYRVTGETEWTDIYDKGVATTSGELVTVDINKENVELRFYNRLVSENAYMTSLEINGNVMSASEAKVAYYDTDGATLVGEQTITKGDADQYPKLTYLYGAENVTVADGNVFRGWFNGTGEYAAKVAEGTELLSDICLYAKATPKETTDKGTEYDYDMTKSSWYQEDHELISIDGSYSGGQHGWLIKKGMTAKINVGATAQLTFKLCKTGSKGAITIKDDKGNTITSFPNRVNACGIDSVVQYVDDKPATLTLSVSADTYIHGIHVVNFIPIYASFKFLNEKTEGELPKKIRGNVNNEITMPTNALFYRKGWTFIGWTDGTNIYDAGKTYSFDHDVTLTPKMRENAIDITETNSEVEVTWPFDHTKAPAINVSKASKVYTRTGTVEGERQDFTLKIDATTGGLNNIDKRINALGNGIEGAAVYDGTKFIISAVYGMTVKICASDKVDAQYNNTTALFGTGKNDSKISFKTLEDSLNTDMTISDDGKTLTLIYKGNDTDLELTIQKAGNTDKNYGLYKGITAIYPVLPDVQAENVIEGTDATEFPNEKAENAGTVKIQSSQSYPNTGSRYRQGDVVTVAATPAYGYKVTGYKVKGSDTRLTTKEVTDTLTGGHLLAADYTVSSGTTHIEAIYEHLPLHKVIVEQSDTALGSVSLSPVYENFYNEVYDTANDGTQGSMLRIESWFTEGTEVTASADAGKGCVVDYWTEKGSDDRLTGLNSYTFKVGDTDRSIVVHLKQGEVGNVIFDISNAHVNGETVASLHKGAISLTIDPIQNVRSFTVPTNYTFFKSVDDNDVNTANAYHLLYWIDKDDDDNHYELGKTYSFKKKQITLTPVFEANPTTRTNRINNPLIRYDFGCNVYKYYDSTSKQQRNTCAPVVNIGNNTDTYWTAQAYFEVLNNGVVTPHTRDVTMYVNTGSKGFIRNSEQSDWCAFGPGTTFWCTSSVGTKVSILTYSKITTTTIDGVVPTLDEARTAEEREKAGSDHVYVYSHTTQNADLTMPIVIGDDYSYYQWIEVSMRAANLVNLHASVDNEQHGKVDQVESLSTYGATELEDGGYAFRQGDRLRVTFERYFGYEFDKIVDIDKTDSDGNPFTLLKMNADSTVSMVDEDYIMHTVAQNADGSWGTPSGEGKTVFTIKATEPTEAEAKSGKRTSYEMEYDITTHRRIQFVFKEKPTYYVTYSSGKYASGIPPVAHWVEAGDEFTVSQNQTLYYEGNTLDCWVDDDYDESMTEEEKAKHTFHTGATYTAQAKDIRLMPLFLPNSFNILNIKKDATITWNFTKDEGAPTIDYEGRAGFLVAQLYDGNRRIDLKINLDATQKPNGKGKFNNTGSSDRIQINPYSIISFPSTPNCIVTFVTIGDKTSTTIVAGKKIGDPGYTVSADKKTIEVVCSGDSAYQEAEITASYFYGRSFAVTYKPQTVSLATIETLTCGDTTLSADEIRRQMDADGHVTFNVSPWSADDIIPPVTGTATMGGYVTATSATVLLPEAVVTVHTAAGVTVKSYPVTFKFTEPEDFPTVEKIIVNGTTYTSQSPVIDNAAPSGSITLAFNRTMAKTTTDQGKPYLESSANAGKELTFKYWDLPAGKTVCIEFTPAQESLKDIYGKVCQQALSITLNIMQEQEQYHHHAFDFIVGKDGSADEAIAAANRNTKENGERYYIFVPNGEYQLTGNEPIKSLGNKNNGVTQISKSNVSLIGQSKEGVTLWNLPETGGISYTGTIHVGKHVNDFYAEDLTLEDRLDYWTAKQTWGVAFWDQGNRSVMKNVSLKSYQDTYFSNNASTGYRGYFENCDISGVVDFLCGDGDIWLEKCNIILRDRGSNNIAAPSQGTNHPWGYVFNNCHIKPETSNPQNLKNYNWTLARPWNGSPACTFLNTKMHILPEQGGWGKMGDPMVLRLHEYHTMDANGVLLSLGTRTLSLSAPAAGSDDCILKQAEAEKYTLRNVVGGTDAFEPDKLCKQIDAVSAKDEDKDENSITWQDNLEIDDDILEWNAQKEALCYFIFKLDEQGNWIYKANTAENSIDLTEYGSGYYCVRAANQRGGLGAATKSIQYVMIDPYELEIKQLDDLTVDGVPYGWSTICLPFNAKVPEDVVVYAASVPQQQDIDEQSANDKITDYKMLLSTVEVIDSMKGYVVYGAAGIHYFKPTSRSCEHESILTGNPTDIAISTTNNSGYVLANKTWGLGFYRYTGQTYAPYRAWLSEDLVSNNVQQGLALGTRLIRFTFADETTHIYAPLYHKSSDNDDIYDLSGKKHKQPINKGIYIIPRKGKVLVK